MARIIKEEEYAVRRNEILDTAQKLIYTKGYELMTIQDILDDLHISKGAFYHYFGSKQALLEGIIERLRIEGMNVLYPILTDPDSTALEKFQHFFTASSRWKTSRKDYLLAVLRMWYADENALVRQKVQPALAQQFMPLLTETIRQGIQEGIMVTPFPEHASGAFLSLSQTLGEAFVAMLFSKPGTYQLSDYESLVSAYTDLLERVLGLASGSLELMDAETIREWANINQAVPASNHMNTVRS